MAWSTRLRGALAVAALASGTALAAEPPKPPAVAPEDAARPVAAIALANPGFESTRPGKLGAPDGWWAVQHAGPESYTFTVDTEVRRSGQRSLRMENVGPEPFGTIYQSIDATPYRGKTLRFAAWVRTDGAQGNRFGAGAGLHLQSSRRGFPRDTAPMRRNAVSGTTAWTRYELVLAVADDVDRVEIGLNLFGPGTAWLDDATLDVVEPPARAAAAPNA